METYKIRNLSFGYPNAEEKALCDITFDIHEGEFVTICGRSGCGKSTLIKHLKPACMPHGKRCGEILFCGEPLDSEDTEKNIKIGLVTQNAECCAVTDKVWHELAFGPESMGLDPDEIRARVAETAAFFGFDGIFHKKVSELSGGQLRILNIAAVLTMHPSVLILDEPTSSLDPISAREVLDAVSHLNRETGITVILAEHRTEDVFALSDRVIVMENGRILADGKPRELAALLAENPMRAALPAAMRVYDKLGDICGDAACPVTVREGRNMLGMCRDRLVMSSVPRRGQDMHRDNETVIELKDVFFRYGKNLPDVVKELSFTVKKSELFAICGACGAGKSTVLSLISGQRRPYRGKVKIFGSEYSGTTSAKDFGIGVLPQEPRDLFVKKTVFLDLQDVLSQTKLREEEKREKIHRISEKCGISHILGCHPYDISGGEQQRAALAKVLLTEPGILLLDEPTKGMDAVFKNDFARFLKKLAKSGVTIVMVSHDTDFCAENADRAVLFFDGNIAAEGTPDRLFAGKSYFTTAASRMSRGIIENAVTVDDIVSAFGKGEARIRACAEDSGNNSVEIRDNLCKNDEKSLDFLGTSDEKTEIKSAVKSDINTNVESNMKSNVKSDTNSPVDSDETEKIRKKNTFLRRAVRMILGLLCAAAVVWLCMAEKHGFGAAEIVYPLLTLLAASGCVACIIPRRKSGVEVKISLTDIRSGNFARHAACALLFVTIVPLTVYAGSGIFENKKYYFVSLLVMLEIFAAFAVMLEGRKPHARELVTISVLCAVGVAGRVAFYSFQQFKPVAAVTVIAGICLGGEAGFLTGAVSAFVSNFFFGQGPWTPWQMTAFGLVGFFAGVVFRVMKVRYTKVSLCIYGVLSVMLIYGGIMNPATVLIGYEKPTAEMIVTAYASGIPFDAIHAASTAFFLWFGAEPIIEKLERIKTKYGF